MRRGPGSRTDMSEATSEGSELPDDPRPSHEQISSSAGEEGMGEQEWGVPVATHQAQEADQLLVGEGGKAAAPGRLLAWFSLALWRGLQSPCWRGSSLPSTCCCLTLALSHPCPASVSSLYAAPSQLGPVFPRLTTCPSKGPACLSSCQAQSSPILQLKSINFSTLCFLYGPTLISIHDYWENHSLD